MSDENAILPTKTQDLNYFELFWVKVVQNKVLNYVSLINTNYTDKIVLFDIDETSKKDLRVVEISFKVRNDVNVIGLIDDLNGDFIIVYLLSIISSVIFVIIFLDNFYHSVSSIYSVQNFEKIVRIVGVRANI